MPSSWETLLLQYMSQHRFLPAGISNDGHKSLMDKVTLFGSNIPPCTMSVLSTSMSFWQFDFLHMCLEEICSSVDSKVGVGTPTVGPETS